jgi:hypothetical protein
MADLVDRALQQAEAAQRAHAMLRAGPPSPDGERQLVEAAGAFGYEVAFERTVKPEGLRWQASSRWGAACRRSRRSWNPARVSTRHGGGSFVT